MDFINTALWATSITLAVFSVIFAIAASVNASKANKSVKDLILTTTIYDEAQNLFFTNINRILFNQKKAKKYLLRNDANYYDYSLNASLSRLAPISKKTFDMFSETEFSTVVSLYYDVKSKLDEGFLEIFKNDIKMLNHSTLISKSHKKRLEKYHMLCIKLAKKIMATYSQIVQE